MLTHKFPKFAFALSLCLAVASASARAEDRPPNFVVIFLDDSGWSDFEPFGQPNYPTPNVDRLAGAGCRYLNFYVPQAVWLGFPRGADDWLLSRPNKSIRRASAERKRPRP